MTKNDQIISVLCLAVGLLIGFGVEKWSADKDMANLKARLTELHLISASGTTMQLLTGAIKSINGNVLHITLLSPKDPFDDPLLDERVVTVNDQTKITVESSKEEVTYSKEMDEWQKERNLEQRSPRRVTGAPIPPAPQMTDKKEASFSALKVGQIVNITTAENVKKEKSFVALGINVLNLSMAFGPSPTSEEPALAPPATGKASSE